MTELSARSVAHMTMTRRGFIGALLLACFLFGSLTVSAVVQEELPPVEIPKTGMKPGQITARHDKSVEISGREYAFQQKVTFADDRGNPREWKEYRQGDYVQYHLKQERIDFLLLELPK